MMNEVAVRIGDCSSSHFEVHKYPTVLQGQHNYAQYTKQSPDCSYKSQSKYKR
jgi:hypothetical protein